MIFDDLSYLRLFFCIEFIDFGTIICFILADDRFIHQESQHLRYIFLDDSFVGIHLCHQERHDVVNRSRESLLVHIRKIAYHKKNIDYSAIERLLFVILDKFQGFTRIRYGTLTKMLHGALEHGTKEPVEWDEFAHLTFCCFLGYGESDVQQGTFVALHLFVYIVHVDKRIEHSHNQLELIGYKWIESCKVFLVLIGLIGTWKNELGIKHSFILLE